MNLLILVFLAFISFLLFPIVIILECYFFGHELEQHGSEKICSKCGIIYCYDKYTDDWR